MRHVRTSLALTALLASACASTEGATEGDTPGLVRLFDGATLDGWHADIMAADEDPGLDPTFIVRDGNLVSLGKPQGHLITNDVYSNYRLVVEYRWPGEPGNCGVLVHASTKRYLYDQFPKSIEVQMHHGNAGDFWCIGEDIRVENEVERRGPRDQWGGEEGQRRRVLNLTDDSEAPLGNWNQMTIECRGGEVRVWVNGDEVNHGTDCTATEGQIALQAEGAEAEFRRVDLIPL